MIRNLKNAVEVGIDCDEMEILAQADEILGRISFGLGDRLDITAIETGEVISSNELPRVRSILGALGAYRGWVISINERVDD